MRWDEDEEYEIEKWGGWEKGGGGVKEKIEEWKEKRGGRNEGGCW